MDPEPESLLAAQLVEQAAQAGAAGLIHLARSEARAARLHQAVRTLAPEMESVLLPGWDCLPYDRISPSRAVMGSRMAALAVLARPARGPRLVVASLAAAMQRLPPPGALDSLTLRQGDALADSEGVREHLLRLGYRLDERVDEPGEAALHGAVLDIFPAGDDTWPCRIELEQGHVAALRRYDPLSQRSVAEVGAVTLGPASEIVNPEGEELPLPPGTEHALAEFHPRLVTLFELLPQAVLVEEPEIEESRARREQEIAEAFRTRLGLGTDEEAAPRLSEPAALYLDHAAWKAAHAGRQVTVLEEAKENPPGRLPRFADAAEPEEAFLGFLDAERQAGRRVALAGPPRAARTLLRLAAEIGRASCRERVL